MPVMISAFCLIYSFFSFLSHLSLNSNTTWWALICSSLVSDIGGRARGGNQWENGMESAEWIRVHVVNSRGDKGNIGMKKSGQCFQLLPRGWRQQSALSNPFMDRALARLISFLFGIDHFFMDSFLHDSSSGLSANSTANSKHDEFSGES